MSDATLMCPECDAFVRVNVEGLPEGAWVESITLRLRDGEEPGTAVYHEDARYTRDHTVTVTLKEARR